MKLFRAIRLKYLQLLRIKDTPHRVALGLSIGIAAGCLPCMGVQSLLALPVAFLIGANKIASLIGVWWTNPITFIPIYYTEYVVGTVFSNYSVLNYAEFYDKTSQLRNLDDVTSLGLEILMPMTLGSLIVATILGPVAFFFFRSLLEKRRDRRLRRRKMNAKFKLQSSTELT